MKCYKVQSLLIDYVYEELSPKKVLEMERHFKSCPECAKKLEEIQFTRNAFSHVEVKVPSGATVEKLLAAAGDAAPRSVPGRRRISVLRTVEFWRPFLAGAASILFMMAIAQMLFHPFTEQVKVPVEVPVSSANEDAGRGIPTHTIAHFNPQNRMTVDRLYDMARLLMFKGYPHDALPMFKAIHQNVPYYENNYMVSLYIGKIYEDDKEYDTACEYYEISLRQKPDNPEARRKIANIEKMLQLQQGHSLQD